jgi:hypothetical protein
MNPARIEALWYEQGTIYDIRTMLYMQSGRRKWIPIRRIRETWAKAQQEGRLPPPEVVRPNDGDFTQDQREIIAFWKHLTKGRDAA